MSNMFNMLNTLSENVTNKHYGILKLFREQLDNSDNMKTCNNSTGPLLHI